MVRIWSYSTPKREIPSCCPSSWIASCPEDSAKRSKNFATLNLVWRVEVIELSVVCIDPLLMSAIVAARVWTPVCIVSSDIGAKEFGGACAGFFQDQDIFRAETKASWPVVRSIPRTVDSEFHDALPEDLKERREDKCPFA